ncbi:MAG: hypothetical protein E2P02_00065 [Acidobacteria bacterium]|nr:MAG: hypothetical protein E2P02_00065 [Acidobacteriota bacterium]
MLLGTLFLLSIAQSIPIPEALSSYVASIEADALGSAEPDIHIETIRPDLYRVRLTYDLETTLAQDDWRVVLRPAFAPSFRWAPHLTPTDEHIIDQHSFRSPALIFVGEGRVLRLIPDLDRLLEGTAVRWYLDLDARSDELTLGMSASDVREHVLFVRAEGARYPAGEVEVSFFLMVSSDAADVKNPFRDVLSFLWERYGRARFESGEPLPPDLMPYVEHTYRWAFDGWRDAVWQEFELDGKRVGAPVFIVNQTQSPNYPGKVDEREFRSIWNQAWFSSLRSASGLYRYARRIGDEALRQKALLTKELALAAPMREGVFPSVIATKMETVDGLNRSQGWQTAYWGNSDRNPINRPAGADRSSDVGIAPYHVLDMSFTALLMLRWNEELEEDPRLVSYAKRYGNRLLGLQDARGFFPAWLDKVSMAPLEILADSPETSMSTTFLLKLADVTGEPRFRAAALRAMDAVAKGVVPQGRWEDFETYWSCSRYGADHLIGRKVARNDMFKQNNFSMFWTAEALFESYAATDEAHYLELGQRVLDELLMTQASWQPPFMYVNVLGGFGVMNSDGEWNDSRESLFSEIILRYGEELDLDEYTQRGLAALRASFVMMYAPENPKTKAQWEKRHPFFGPADYGFTMENYGHGGKTSAEGMGMGVFTIYDWGNGAAAEAVNRLIDHYGRAFVERAR